MVDIETVGTGTNARITQIGAVAFDFNEGVLEAHELLQMDDRCFNAALLPYEGATQDAGAMKFWADPAQAEALAEIKRMPHVGVDAALSEFTKFCSTWLRSRGKMWAKPPQFDLRIIRETYALRGTDHPWAYNQEHDLRTLMFLAKQVPMVNFKVPDVSEAKLIPHFALHDAVEQAVLAQAAFRSLSAFSRDRSRAARGIIVGSKKGEADAEPKQ